MAKKKRRKKPQKKISVLTTAGAAAGVVSAFEIAGGFNQSFLPVLIANYTGFNPQNQEFSLDKAKRGLLPLLLGAGAGMVASKAGVNRRLNIPFIKV